MSGIYSPIIQDPSTRALYDIETLNLGQIIYTMTNHQFSFEQIRSMTLEEVIGTMTKINKGEIKTWDQVKAEEKEARRSRGKK